MKTLDQSIKDAIASIKNGYYKGKAIKIELEAQFDRDTEDEYCQECDEGSYECQDCYADGCDNCDGGYITCESCDGTGNNSIGQWSDMDCKDFIYNHVPANAVDKLVYGRFYNDGSVDSEFTFTLMLDDVEYAIDFIKAFKLLGEAISSNFDTTGAGMHIAILNSKRGNYPSGNRIEANYFRHMQTAVEHLMPALFFLATADWKSRSIHYRMPQASESKYSAIHWCDGGALEFRVFETCYDKPAMFYDFLCVIAKCLEFYQPKVTKLSFFGTIGELAFKESGNGVSRFYYSTKHLDALNAGLVVLKPDHKTVKQLKQERNFKISKARLTKNELKLQVQWRAEYRERKQRESRYTEDIEAISAKYRYKFRHEYRRDYSNPESYWGMSEAIFIKEGLKNHGFNALPKTVTTYIKDKHKEFISSSTSGAVVMV